MRSEHVFAWQTSWSEEATSEEVAGWQIFHPNLRHYNTETESTLIKHACQDSLAYRSLAIFLLQFGNHFLKLNPQWVDIFLAPCNSAGHTLYRRWEIHSITQLNIVLLRQLLKGSPLLPDDELYGRRSIELQRDRDLSALFEKELYTYENISFSRNRIKKLDITSLGDISKRVVSRVYGCSQKTVENE